MEPLGTLEKPSGEHVGNVCLDAHSALGTSPRASAGVQGQRSPTLVKATRKMSTDIPGSAGHRAWRLETDIQSSLTEICNTQSVTGSDTVDISGTGSLVLDN